MMQMMTSNEFKELSEKISAAWELIPEDKLAIYGRVFDFMIVSSLIYRRLDDGTRLCISLYDQLQLAEKYTHTYEVKAVYRHLQDMLKPWSGGRPSVADGMIDQIAGWFKKSMGVSGLPGRSTAEVMGYCNEIIEKWKARPKTDKASA